MNQAPRNARSALVENMSPRGMLKLGCRPCTRRPGEAQALPVDSCASGRRASRSSRVIARDKLARECSRSGVCGARRRWRTAVFAKVEFFTQTIARRTTGVGPGSCIVFRQRLALIVLQAGHRDRSGAITEEALFVSACRLDDLHCAGYELKPRRAAGRAGLSPFKASEAAGLPGEEDADIGEVAGL
jgi:hypothetical protein